ncbi:unnamed protein product [Didymodactylos carnosus]|uniref:G-protein coupled receptors family 1 profile domain-containing protein n=1 Tax=Didymodactylos carnosus TaxID=1234261 RepID=A0A815IJY6_9BILA|nr:unnamed protein product [Didymodactylos carnosus]CAF4248148.1 unnamed protein product [Didymodactylos carnosus]
MPCRYGGTCIPLDPRIGISYYCLCREESTGGNCEYLKSKLQVSTTAEIEITSSALIHFINTVSAVKSFKRHTLFKRIPTNEQQIRIYTSFGHNLAYMQFQQSTYYLIILKKEPTYRGNDSTTLVRSNRCPSIRELFDQNILSYHWLKRVKHYHQPCQQRYDLKCFHDERQMCLCTEDHRADCFQFDHNMTYNCNEYNYCENGAQCFYEGEGCPQDFMCVCPECYYGTMCQFSTSAFSLSLDAIIGYQIQPKTDIKRQPVVVKLTIATTTIMFIFGMALNICSIITFSQKRVQDASCGTYLLSSSVVSLVTIFIFALKVLSLLLIQIMSLTNLIFLYINCILIDFLLKFLLACGDWLSVCVTIDRALTASKTVISNKQRSKRMTRIITIFILCTTVLLVMHDPMNRRLIKDPVDQRQWCIVSYQDSLKIYDTIINTMNFIVPFVINVISAIIIIVTTTRHRSSAQKRMAYYQLLKIQLKQHRHLIISPCILVLLALPRLILSFVSGCMKSTRNPWLALSGYFISFIPSMTIFFVFVMPSKLYIEEFHASLRRYQKRFSELFV